MVQYDALAIEDINIYRHWHPGSEKYCGGDALATALYLDWKMGEIVYKEEHWHAGVRCADVYHFTLEREGEQATMPVVSNPYVQRLISESPVQVISMAERVRLERSSRTAKV